MDLDKSIKQAVANSKVEKQHPTKEELLIIKDAIENKNSPESLIYRINEFYKNDNNQKQKVEKEDGKTRQK